MSFKLLNDDDERLLNGNEGMTLDGTDDLDEDKLLYSSDEDDSYPTECDIDSNKRKYSGSSTTKFDDTLNKVNDSNETSEPNNEKLEEVQLDVSKDQQIDDKSKQENKVEEKVNDFRTKSSNPEDELDDIDDRESDSGSVKRGDRFHSERKDTNFRSNDTSSRPDIPDTLEITKEDQKRIDSFSKNERDRKSGKGKWLKKGLKEKYNTYNSNNFLNRKSTQNFFHQNPRMGRINIFPPSNLVTSSWNDSNSILGAPPAFPRITTNFPMPNQDHQMIKSLSMPRKPSIVHPQHLLYPTASIKPARNVLSDSGTKTGEIIPVLTNTNRDYNKSFEISTSVVATSQAGNPIPTLMSTKASAVPSIFDSFSQVVANDITKNIQFEKLMDIHSKSLKRSKSPSPLRTSDQKKRTSVRSRSRSRSPLYSSRYSRKRSKYSSHGRRSKSPNKSSKSSRKTELPVKARTIHINPHFKGKVNIPTSKTLRQTNVSKNSVIQTFTSTPATNSLSYQPSLNLPSNKATNQVVPTPNLPVPSNLSLPALPPLGILPAVLNRPPPPLQFLHQLHSIGIPKVHIPPQIFPTNIAQALRPPTLQYKHPLVPVTLPVVSNNIPIPAAASVASDVKDSSKVYQVETSKSSKKDVEVDPSEIRIKPASSVITLTGVGLAEKDQIKFDKKHASVPDTLKTASTSRLKPPPYQKSATNKNEDEVNAMIWSSVEDANGTYKRLIEVQQLKRKEYLAKKAKFRLADAAKVNSSNAKLSNQSVKISNLPSSTKLQTLLKLFEAVGPTESLKYKDHESCAVGTFKRSSDAKRFTEKYNRYLLDRSYITVSLLEKSNSP